MADLRVPSPRPWMKVIFRPLREMLVRMMRRKVSSWKWRCWPLGTFRPPGSASMWRSTVRVPFGEGLKASVCEPDLEDPYLPEKEGPLNPNPAPAPCPDPCDPHPRPAFDPFVFVSLRLESSLSDVTANSPYAASMSKPSSSSIFTVLPMAAILPLRDESMSTTLWPTFRMSLLVGCPSPVGSGCLLFAFFLEPSETEGAP